MNLILPPLQVRRVLLANGIPPLVHALVAFRARSWVNRVESGGSSCETAFVPESLRNLRVGVGRGMFADALGKVGG